MLPYTKVTTQFASVTPATVEFRYNGAMFGKARRLHDLVSKKFFTPRDADCLLDAMDLTGNEIVYENYEYPGMVSVHVQGCKYFSSGRRQYHRSS